MVTEQNICLIVIVAGVTVSSVSYRFCSSAAAAALQQMIHKELFMSQLCTSRTFVAFCTWPCLRYGVRFLL